MAKVVQEPMCEMVLTPRHLLSSGMVSRKMEEGKGICPRLPHRKDCAPANPSR